MSKKILKQAMKFSHDKVHCKSCGMMHEKTHPHVKKMLGHEKHMKHEKKIPKTFGGKSTKLGHGGRAKMLASELGKKGLPKSEIGGILGKIARAKGTAPGQPKFHGKNQKYR